MQFSDAVMEFIVSVKKIAYKIIGFVFVKAKDYLFKWRACKNKFDWRLQWCFLLCSLNSNSKTY